MERKIPFSFHYISIYINTYVHILGDNSMHSSHSHSDSAISHHFCMHKYIKHISMFPLLESFILRLKYGWFVGLIRIPFISVGHTFYVR
jgi:hypothetical protein